MGVMILLFWGFLISILIWLLVMDLGFSKMINWNKRVVPQNSKNRKTNMIWREKEEKHITP